MDLESQRLTKWKSLALILPASVGRAAMLHEAFELQDAAVYGNIWDASREWKLTHVVWETRVCHILCYSYFSRYIAHYLHFFRKTTTHVKLYAPAFLNKSKRNWKWKIFRNFHNFDVYIRDRPDPWFTRIRIRIRIHLPDSGSGSGSQIFTRIRIRIRIRILVDKIHYL